MLRLNKGRTSLIPCANTYSVMDESGTEADANAIEETSMNNNTNNTGTTASEALKEWMKRNTEAKKEEPKGLPKRNPDRDVSRNGNQKVRLSPKRHDWNRDKVRWSIRANNPITKPKP